MEACELPKFGVYRAAIKSSKTYKGKLKEKDYRKVVSLFIQNLLFQFVKTGRGLHLPAKLGFIKPYKVHWKGRFPNFHMTTLVYGEHNKLNPDSKKFVSDPLRKTNGYGVKVLINYARCGIPDHKNYIFDLVRTAKRKNIYHVHHSKIRLYEFFNEEGYRFYDEIQPKHE